MRVQLSRMPVRVELGQTVEFDREALVGDDPRIVEVQISVLPHDAERVQLIVMTTFRDDEEQAAYEQAVVEMRLDLLEDLGDDWDG